MKMLNRGLLRSHNEKKRLRGLSDLQDVPWSQDPAQPSSHSPSPSPACSHVLVPMCSFTSSFPLSGMLVPPSQAGETPPILRGHNQMLSKAFLHLSWHITPTSDTKLSVLSSWCQHLSNLLTPERGQQDMPSGNLESGGGDKSKEIHHFKLRQGIRRKQGKRHHTAGWRWGKTRMDGWERLLGRRDI